MLRVVRGSGRILALGGGGRGHWRRLQTSPDVRGDGVMKVTEKCKERLRKILNDKSFLRISVESGGCSGFQYKFEIDSEMGKDDVIVHNDKDESHPAPAPAVVVIDNLSLDIIKGSTLDYETELIRSAFRIINNPMAEQGCSCGASFNMKI